MRITITGGGGFLGQKLAARLVAEGALGGRAITGLTLFDLAAPGGPAGASFPIVTLAGDIGDPTAAIPPGTDIVVHLAAVVSAAAEADWALGMRVNLGGTLAVIEACRALAKPPRLVFTASVATFAGGQNTVVAEDARQMPGNSYGAQKAAAELLLADATRRGMIDAVSLRLPTVIVRPGKPNAAASSFASSILREPLLGLAAALPVREDFALWVCSPRRAVDWLLHAAAIDSAALGADRGINPPGLTVTVGEMLDALEAVGGAAARRLVQPVDAPEIATIVGGWPARFADARARALGFKPVGDPVSILREFIEDELPPMRR